MTDAEVRLCSQVIMHRLFSAVSFERVRTLHTYLPIPGHNEIDTGLLVSEMYTRYPKVKLATWLDYKIGFESGWIDQRSAKQHIVSPQTIFDVIIVPVVAFSEQRFRIGFGGGFYDRFLAAQPNAQKIGLAYQQSQYPFEPESFDIKLDMIVTEERLYE